MMKVKWNQIEQDGHIYVVALLGEITSSHIVSRILQKYGYSLLPVQVGSGKIPLIGIEHDFFICGNDDKGSIEKIEELKEEVEMLLCKNK